MTVSSLPKLSVVALLGMLLAGPAYAQQAAPVPVPDAARATDLIQDEPGYTTALYNAVTGAASWSWSVVSSGFSTVTPPSPSDLASSMSGKDQDELVKLLDTAGYKLKEISTDVGLIPGIDLAFGMIRELSEADLEYLESELERSRIIHPGFMTGVKRAIVETVLTINSGGAYNVTELHVTLLPLPAVQFSVAPVQAPLSDESSALMRAIQRVDKNVRNIAGGVHGGGAIETSVKLVQPPQAAGQAEAPPGSQAGTKSTPKTNPTKPTTPMQSGDWASGEFLGLDAGQWLFGGAMLLIVLGLLIELVRRLINEHVGSFTPATYALFAASGAVWAVLAQMTQSWLMLAGAALLSVCAIALLLQRLLPTSMPANAMPADSSPSGSNK